MGNHTRRDIAGLRCAIWLCIALWVLAGGILAVLKYHEKQGTFGKHGVDDVREIGGKR